MANFAIRTLAQDELKGTRMALSTASLLWAVQLFLSIDMFPIEGTVYGQRFISEVVAWFLGIGFLLHGAVGWWVLARPDKVSTGFRLFGSCCGALLWTYATILYAILGKPSLIYLFGNQYNFLPMPIAGQTVFTVIAWWAVARAWTDHTHFIIIKTSKGE